jgi:hypothetical protein
MKIVGCREGRDLGQQQEIRVFDIKHIKGLEFEAVFFVGVDQLARGSRTFSSNTCTLASPDSPRSMPSAATATGLEALR